MSELAKQLADLEVRTYTKEQIQQFIADDKLDTRAATNC